jgi:hypothetical protein
MMCDHKAAECVDSTGGIESGFFEEHYECPCGAEGWIHGDASAQPSEWNFNGDVFE